mmetsp:Transcript_6957/g.42550  ORF Transcript_6957/g.42550 Transcript_6957/m.42550 type:complete len:283 (+) Transcript_6957:2428-3276(+)
MERSEYEALRKKLSLPVKYQPAYAELSRQHPNVSYDTMVSIYSQECARRVRKTFNESHHKRPDAMNKYAKRYLAGETLAQIAHDIDLPACLLARLMLQTLLGLHKQTVGTVMKDPHGLLREDVNVPREAMDSGLVERLKTDILLAVDEDHVSSPYVNTVQRVMGLEYESLLCEKLVSLDIPFYPEDALRAEGLAKTPDVKLELPIAVDDHIVHWIDSKACFCDSHGYIREASAQFQGYVHRYGPGMVIYWFGFIKELQGEQPGVLLVDDFPSPSRITKLTCS